MWVHHCILQDFRFDSIMLKLFLLWIRKVLTFRESFKQNNQYKIQFQKLKKHRASSGGWNKNTARWTEGSPPGARHSGGAGQHRPASPPPGSREIVMTGHWLKVSLVHCFLPCMFGEVMARHSESGGKKEDLDEVFPSRRWHATGPWQLWWSTTAG